MREMKDSGIEWIGKIPKEWSIVKFKCLHNGLNTGEAIDKEYWESDAGLNAFYTAGLTPIRTGYSNFPTWKETRENDLLLARNGTPYVYLPVSKAYYTDHIIRAAMSSLVNRRFIRYCLQQSIASIAVDSVSIPTWSATLWNNQILTWPSVIEQERIAAFLDAECAEIDAVLEKTRASIEEYKKLKQAVITQAVTKGIRGDRPMKDSGIEWIGEIANEFAVYKFKYLLKTPMQYGANEAGITFDKTLPRYIRITDITSDGRLKQDNRLCIEDTVAKPYILQDGDLLFARSGGTVGKSFLYKQSYGNAAFAGYLIRAVVNRTIAVPEYVYYYTNSSIYDTWKNSIFIQSTIQNIGADRYSNMPIIVPNNIEEQRSIVEYLNERCVGIDALIRKKQQYLTEIENYKKSLIYEYVTGKKEVLPL